MYVCGDDTLWYTATTYIYTAVDDVRPSLLALANCLRQVTRDTHAYEAHIYDQLNVLNTG